MYYTIKQVAEMVKNKRIDGISDIKEESEDDEVVEVKAIED